MNKKKTIIAAVVLLLVFLVGGAIAYFTDTDTATNTFTIGSIDISLSEPLWDALTDTDQDGIPNDAEDMMPGESVTKDPTITNDSTANAAYVFAKVEIPCSSDATPIEAFELGSIGSGWTLMSDGACTLNTTTNKYVATKIYNYGTSGAMTSLAASASTSPVFSSITLNNDIDGTQTGLTGNLNVVVTGYGIQAEGLSSAVPSTVWGEFPSA